MRFVIPGWLIAGLFVTLFTIFVPLDIVWWERAILIVGTIISSGLYLIFDPNNAPDEEDLNQKENE